MSSISSWSSINKKERKNSINSSENRDKAEFQEFLEYKRRKSSTSQASIKPKIARDIESSKVDSSSVESTSVREDAALLTPALSHSFRIKRDGEPTVKTKRAISRVETSDTLIVDSDDQDFEKQDAQNLTPPPSPPPRKKKLLEKRIRGVHEKKRLFHDDEYEDEEDEDENAKTGKIIQEEFSENQIREIEKECATDAKSNETKNFTSLSYEGPAKYKKVEADVGRCMFAYYTQTNEDKLASFNPIWVNIGPPNVAKEMVCLRKNTRFEQKGKKNGHVDNHASYLVVAFENRKKASSPYVEYSLSRIGPLIKGLEKLKEIAMSQGLYNTSLDQTIQEKIYPKNAMIHPSDGQQTILPLK